jgi:hypothetical protein
MSCAFSAANVVFTGRWAQWKVLNAVVRQVSRFACMAAFLLAAASSAQAAQPSGSPEVATQAALCVADDEFAGPVASAERGKSRDGEAPKPAPSPYKTLFFENDFSYLDDPKFNDYRLGDSWKRLRVGCRTWIDVGGEYRLRHHHEVNLRNSSLTGLSDDFLLGRTRTYLDLKHGGWARFYGEMIDAPAWARRSRHARSKRTASTR